MLKKWDNILSEHLLVIIDEFMIYEFDQLRNPSNLFRYIIGKNK